MSIELKTIIFRFTHLTVKVGRKRYLIQSQYIQKKKKKHFNNFLWLQTITLFLTHYKWVFYPIYIRVIIFEGLLHIILNDFWPEVIASVFTKMFKCCTAVYLRGKNVLGMVLLIWWFYTFLNTWSILIAKWNGTLSRFQKRKTSVSSSTLFKELLQKANK